MNAAERILSEMRRIEKAKELRYCPGWDGVEHIVDDPDGKGPGELCNKCLVLRTQHSR
jgi:hypothetical protein